MSGQEASEAVKPTAAGEEDCRRVAGRAAQRRDAAVKLKIGRTNRLMNFSYRVAHVAQILARGGVGTEALRSARTSWRLEDEGVLPLVISQMKRHPSDPVEIRNSETINPDP